MVNINQDNGITENGEPLLTLSKYRREREKIYFGILLYIEYGNKISVGDEFKINHRL